MTRHKSLILLFYRDSASRREGSTVSALKANCMFRKDKVRSQEQCGSQLMSPAGPTERSLARTAFAPEAEGNPVPRSPPRHAAATPAHRDRQPPSHLLTAAPETADNPLPLSLSRLRLSNWREPWRRLRGVAAAKLPCKREDAASFPPAPRMHRGPLAPSRLPPPRGYIRAPEGRGRAGRVASVRECGGC